MGFHMAGNVRKKMDRNSTLHIFDVNTAACQRFVETFSTYGPITIAGSAKDVARVSKTVISMLPMDQHARAVHLDRVDGIIAAPACSSRLILECSTLSIKTGREIGEQMMKAGAGAYLDTPVSGGVGGAEAGTLSFFCGYSDTEGTKAIANRTRDVLAWMGSAARIHFCGDLGAGLVSKIVNNYMGLGNLAVAAQGMAFGVRHGIDRKTLFQCIRGSSGDSWVWEFMQPAPGVIPRTASSQGFKAGFTPRLCVKDIGLGITAAQEVGIDATIGKVALELYKQADQDPRTSVSFHLFSLPSHKTSLSCPNTSPTPQHLDCSSIWLHINHEVDSFALSK